MTTGLSGTYAFNGTDLTLQPTEGRWIERNNYGMDGGGHPIYPAIRSFELTWALMPTSDAKQIIDFYNSVGNTGTITSCLPQWGNVGFNFANYSGCTLAEPTVGAYFVDHVQDVRLVIMGVRVS